MLPCIICGARLDNVWEHGDSNQPSEGTEFQTYGHYGSTFWDSFEGEQLVLNICDDCLKKHSDRLARRKSYRRVVVTDLRGSLDIKTTVGREWLERETVPYFNGPEDIDPVEIEPEEIGVLTGTRIEWIHDWRDTKKQIMAATDEHDGLSPCKHVEHVAECPRCGARPLQGLR